MVWCIFIGLLDEKEKACIGAEEAETDREDNTITRINTNDMDWRDQLIKGVFDLLYKMIKDVGNTDSAGIIEESDTKVVIEMKKDGDVILMTKEQDITTGIWYYAADNPEKLF